MSKTRKRIRTPARPGGSPGEQTLACAAVGGLAGGDGREFLALEHARKLLEARALELRLVGLPRSARTISRIVSDVDLWELP